jgi:nucleotide-binding universal stress UspA family protein
MSPIRSILVPTDFSETADRAIEQALVLAQKFEAKITLLHVLSMPVYSYMDGASWPIDGIRAEAAKAIEEAASKVRARWPRVDASLVEGVAWEEIVRLATDRDVDVIVMGTHGRRGFSRMLVGSVAERVVRLSPAPVMTVGATRPSEPRAGG